MRKPVKPGTEASKTREGGALGNIDEETGHPGKGGGRTLRPEDDGKGATGRGATGGKGG